MMRSHTQPGAEHSQNILLDTMKNPAPPLPVPIPTAQEFVAQMDEIGYDKIFIPAIRMWSHWDKKMIWDYTIDEVHDHIKDFPDRLIPAVGYNPYRIEESLQEIERGVKEYGAKYCYFHSLTFGVPLNDKRLYPCYAKCSELGIPVGMQTGHAAELFPSWPGNPMNLDEVALDFPGLTLIGSHTGWPWVNELVCMAWKHPNVYCDCSAWMPKLLPKLHPQLMIFMQFWAGQEKVIFGTNNMGLKAFKEQFLALPLSDEAKRMIMRDNAIKVFGL
jgi:predicted TIM-barrel fold metal-dependent hydrolase